MPLLPDPGLTLVCLFGFISISGIKIGLDLFYNLWVVQIIKGFKERDRMNRFISKGK